MTAAAQAVPAATTDTARARNQASETYDDFLQMLTTQLRNQDPLSPMEAAEFTNQLVAFSQVEQQIQTNENLNSLIALQSTGGIGDALGYLGHEVEVIGDTFRYDEAPVTVGYGTPDGASDVLVQVLNRNGQVVHQERGETMPGRHELTWDGTAADGTELPPDVYRIRVTAATGAEEPAELPTFVRGTVSGVQTLDGETRLLIGGLAVDPNDVLTVRPLDAA